MRKLKHIDILVSDNKKKNKRYFTIIHNNKRCKYEFGSNEGNKFLESLNILTYNTTFKFVSKFRFNKEVYNLINIHANYYNFQIGGITIKKTLSL